MDAERFDRWTRAFLTRRTALSVLIGGLAALTGAFGLDDVEAGKRRKKERKRKRRRKRRPLCVPEAAAITCAGAICGVTRANNCGQAVICGCPDAGDDCLPNGTCAAACAGTVDCPSPNCLCTFGVEGEKYCGKQFALCSDVPVVCEATADCPLNHFCMNTGCGGGDGPRCVPLCDA